MIDLAVYFDEIYCINLKRRVDRKEQFKSNYPNLGTNKVTFFNAVDGNQINDNEWKFPKGALGCRLSHLELYKNALKKNQSKILILEDDVLIKADFRKSINEINQFLGDDWDMIYFGGYHFLKPELVHRNILKLKNTLALHAVAINSRCLPQIIKKIEEDKRSIDSVIADLHSVLKVYGFKKPLAIQRKGFSDILNKEVNYNGSFLGRVYLGTYKIIRKLF